MWNGRIINCTYKIISNYANNCEIKSEIDAIEIKVKPRQKKKIQKRPKFEISLFRMQTMQKLDYYI